MAEPSAKLSSADCDNASLSSNGMKHTESNNFQIEEKVFPAPSFCEKWSGILSVISCGFFLVTLLFLAGVIILGSNSKTSKSSIKLTELTFSKHVVLSPDKTCSRLGTSTLEGGANAVEAAIAVQLCLGVRIPHRAGLMAGNVALVFQSGDDLSFYDGWFMSRYNQISNRSSNRLAEVTLPGELYSLRKMCNDHCKKYKNRFTDIIKLALEGSGDSIPVTSDLQTFLSTCSQNILPLHKERLNRKPYRKLLQKLVKGKYKRFYSFDFPDVWSFKNASDPIFVSLDFSNYKGKVFTETMHLGQYSKYRHTEILTGSFPTKSLALHYNSQLNFLLQSNKKFQGYTDMHKWSFSLYKTKQFTEQFGMNGFVSRMKLKKFAFSKEYIYNLTNEIKIFKSEKTRDKSDNDIQNVYVSVIDKNGLGANILSTNAKHHSCFYRPRVGIFFNDGVKHFADTTCQESHIPNCATNHLKPICSLIPVVLRPPSKSNDYHMITTIGSDQIGAISYLLMQSSLESKNYYQTDGNSAKSHLLTRFDSGRITVNIDERDATVAVEGT